MPCFYYTIGGFMYNQKSNIIKRHWQVSLQNEETQETIEISVENPNIKTLKEVENVNENATIDELIQLMAKLLSKNKQNKAISVDFLSECVDVDELVQMFADFTSWLSGEKIADPN